MQILENIKNRAQSKGAELDDDEVSLIIDQMAVWAMSTRSPKSISPKRRSGATQKTVLLWREI